MRNSFIKSLVETSKTNTHICLMIGDLGYGAVEPFANEYPERFINAGIAEQNMAGMAAGMAMAGKHVFTYSIGNFPTFRCAEQLRNDIDYHNLNVTTVAVGGGLSYGALGYSHHTIQDFGLMRLLPNTMILAPCDPVEVAGCLEFIVKNPQPSYFRLGKTGEKVLTTAIALNPGCINKVYFRDAKQAIVTTGAVIQNLPKKYIETYDVYSMPIWGEGVSLDNLEDIFNYYSEVLIVEDHLKSGGFFSWILENLNHRKNIQNIRSLALSSQIIGKVGSHYFLQDKFLIES